MQQVLAVWNNLSAGRRIVAILATVAMFLSVLMLSKVATAPHMALLYAGLDGKSAGEVVAALEQKGTKFEIRNDAIYVDAAERDTMRMVLAGEGLPRNGAAGYELLDTLTGFGTTSQMFDATYWRAKEGELTRTIMAGSNIRAARVHIANASTQRFQRDVSLSASVSVSTLSGRLSHANARALRYLVASSVAGLSPEAVSVIDTERGAVLDGDGDFGGLSSQGERESKLRRNVERLLDARVGPGRSIVELTLETVTERESITERRFDPDSRVAISTETIETSNSSKDTRGGSVTVASNLPEGDAGAGQDSNASSNETRERVNFELSETQRELVRNPGAVKRLTIAVLVDGTRRIGDDGQEVWEPLPDDEIDGLRDLVASAVGYDEARGDVITLKSMPIAQADPIAAADTSQGLFLPFAINPLSAIQMAVLAVVTLVLGLFVVRPILTAKPSPAALPNLAPSSLPSGPATAGVDGEITNFGDVPAQLARPAEPQTANEDPVARLRGLITERQTESVEILRNWMSEEREEKV